MVGVGGRLSEGLSPALREEFALEVGNRIGELSAHVHSVMAEIVALAADFDGDGGWIGQGYRSFAHWFTVNCGFDAWLGQEVCRVGSALRDLPLTRAAFEEGRLSFDKVRTVTRVACAAEDEMWLNLALDASGNQLARICRAVGRALEADSPERASDQQLRRGLRTQWLDNGMLHVVGLLPPADGKLLLEALDAAMVKPEETTDQTVIPDRAIDPWMARREDALALVLSKGLGTLQDESDVVAARNQVVVHVDFDLLTGLTDSGRCFLEDGPPVALSTLQRLGCTASVVTMIERDGQVLDVLPARRYPTIRQRRVIAHRDRTCLFHHQRLHDGAFRMTTVAPGVFRFETAAGQPIPPAPPVVNPLTGGVAHLEHRAVERGLAIEWERSVARGHGEAFDLDLTVAVAIDNPRSRQLERGSPVLPAP